MLARPGRAAGVGCRRAGPSEPHPPPPGPTSGGGWNRRRAILPAIRAGSASVDGRATGMETRLFESPMPSVERACRGEGAAPREPCRRSQPRSRAAKLDPAGVAAADSSIRAPTRCTSPALLAFRNVCVHLVPHWFKPARSGTCLAVRSLVRDRGGMLDNARRPRAGALQLPSRNPGLIPPTPLPCCTPPRACHFFQFSCSSGVRRPIGEEGRSKIWQGRRVLAAIKGTGGARGWAHEVH